MSTFPSTLSTFTDPIPTNRLNSPSHASVEGDQNDGIKKLETFIGTLSSTAGTLMYDVRAAASNGGGHVQTANKGGTGQTTYTKGDMLVPTSSSVLAKLAVGNNLEVLTADSTAATGVKWTAAGTVKVYIPLSSSGTQTTAVSSMVSSVAGHTGLFTMPIGMVVNKVVMDFNSVLAAGSYKIGLYTEDGQTQVTSMLVSSVTANGIKSTNVSSVVLSAQNYYAVVVPLDGGGEVRTWATGAGPTGNFINQAGTKFFTGTQTVTAGTLPATFNTSILTFVNNQQVALKFEN